jgi:uncharacterized membrane protein
MPKAEHSIIVSAPVEEVFAAFSQFDRFPEFMHNIKSVEKTGDRMSHWVAKGPLGTSVEWDAETTLWEPNKRLAWNSRDHGDITTSGQVTFTELANNQTQVNVLIKYEPPMGAVGDIVSKIFGGNPQQELEEDLEKFASQIKHQKSYSADPNKTYEREA